LRGGHDMATDAGSWDADDEAAYAGLYLRSYPRVRRTVGVILRDRSAAEDVTQDAFVQLYVHWRKVSRYENPEGWVRRVAIRLATRTAKRDRVREVLSLRGTTVPRADEPADLDLERAIAGLTPIQRAVVALYYFDDLPVDEVSRLTGRSQTATKVALHRARKRLAELMGVEAGRDG
jgi:RNA polymerase sigma factor (sigma-70 family)